MIKIRSIFMMMSAAVLTVACSSDELALTHPDGYGEVSFNIGNDMLTRAPGNITYVPYDYDRDPHTMGVIGWYDLQTENAFTNKKMFDNLCVTAKKDEELGTIAWEYSPIRYWIEFADYQTFDNFAYMPHSEDVSIAKEGNVYTLSMPVDFGEYAAFSPVETALFCNLPDAKVESDGVIQFKMDQTLTGFQLVFQLGEKMSNIRYFAVKSVKVYGDGFVNKGTVSRAYTWNTTTQKWTSGDITWDIDAEHNTINVAQADAAPIPYVDNSMKAPVDEDWTPYYDNEQSVLRVNGVAVPWGNPIYVLPAVGFNPTFEVTYDAVVVDENNQDVVTRKDVVSTIQFTQDFFEGLKTATATQMGKTRAINVKIVPDHLYVLADPDQTFGYIPVSD